MRAWAQLSDDADLWHPSGWSPVYDGMPSTTRLVGFTTLRSPVPNYKLSYSTGRDDGVFYIGGDARRMLAGEFYGWVVISGDWRHMPDFWPV